MGWQKNLHPNLAGQFGVALGASTNASLTGHIWEDADPAFNNFDYGYTLTHSQVALEGKLRASGWQVAMPYVSGSVGVAFNRSQSFVIRPLISEEVAAPAFQSNTTTAFTYTVGAGLQKSLSANWQTGIGYAFSDWGQSKLSPAPGQTLSTAPRLSHLYVNSLVFNVSYLK